MENGKSKETSLFLSVCSKDYKKAVDTLKGNLGYAINKCHWLKNLSKTEAFNHLLAIFKNACEEAVIFEDREMFLSKIIKIMLEGVMKKFNKPVDIAHIRALDMPPLFFDKPFLLKEVKRVHFETAKIFQKIPPHIKAEFERMSLLSAFLQLTIAELNYVPGSKEWSTLLSSFSLMFFEIFLTINNQIFNNNTI